MKKKPALLLLPAALLAACLLAAGCAADAPAPAPSSPAPAESSSAAQAPASSSQSGEGNTAAQLGSLCSFTAGTLDGGSFGPEDLAEKDITIVNFWATFCGPCIAEMPDLAALAGALPDNVGLVTVCLDGGGDPEAVRKLVDDAGYTGATILTGDGDLGALAGMILYIPTTVLADSQGNLVGDPIIGGQQDLAATYLAAVNSALAAAGKAEISLGE